MYNPRQDEIRNATVEGTLNLCNAVKDDEAVVQAVDANHLRKTRKRPEERRSTTGQSHPQVNEGHHSLNEILQIHYFKEDVNLFYRTLASATPIGRCRTRPLE
jgi:hypothetical protein